MHDAGPVDAFGELDRFRCELHRCLTGRPDALFELTEAVLCSDGPVKSLVGLSLALEHRRGHGAMYDALNQGRIDVQRLRTALAGLPLPRCGDGRLMLTVDVSAWLCPDAATSPDRLFCHVYGRGRNKRSADSGVAVLVRGRVGAGPHVVDSGAGRGPVGPG